MRKHRMKCLYRMELFILVNLREREKLAEPAFTAVSRSMTKLFIRCEIKCIYVILMQRRHKMNLLHE